MPTDKKKNRKRRGHVSCGHGRIGKHRKHPGGRGNAGGQHHHRILFDKFHPGHFKKIGMRYFHKTKQRNFCPSLNLEKLKILYFSNDKFLENSKGGAPIIDITKFGYYKMLGKGKVPNTPFQIKAKFFSKKAEIKIKKAGGQCIVIP